MAYHFCDNNNCGNPMTHTVQLAESDDGISWSAMPGFTGYQGSVPDPIIRGEKCYIYTPGKVRRYNRITDSWETTSNQVQIKDALGNIVSYVDPSALVDQDGLINLFFLNSTGIMGDPAQCASPPCIRNFDSAIEVPGSDGTQFVVQNGHRISITVNGNWGPTDPDLFSDGANYYLYLSQGTTTLVYRSSTLHGSYSALTTLPNGNQLTNSAGIPSGMYRVDQGLYYSYGHMNNAGQTEIRLATHTNFNAQPTYSAIVTAASTGLASTVSVASPGICENTFLLQGVIEQSTYSPKVSIVPNPVEGLLHLAVSAKGEFDIEIFSSDGRSVLSIDGLTTNTTLDFPMADLANGLYYLQLHNEGGTTVQHFLKK